MLKIIDSLKEEFVGKIEISDCDKNGKQYVNTRWVYPSNKERYANVLIEIWWKPRKNRVDFVFNRDLLTPSENIEAVLDGNHRAGNTNRGLLERYDMSEQELKEFVLDKIEKYCDLSE